MSFLRMYFFGGLLSSFVRPACFGICFDLIKMGTTPRLPKIDSNLGR